MRRASRLRVVAAMALVAGCAQSGGTLVYAGTIHLELTSPIQRVFDGPGTCELSPAGFNAFAAVPMQRDSDLLSPDVTTSNGNAVTVGVNGSLGYTAAFPSPNARVTV